MAGDITTHLYIHRRGGLQAEVGIKAGHAMNTVQRYIEALGEPLQLGDRQIPVLLLNRV
jgi:hypothetical protein